MSDPKEQGKRDPEGDELDLDAEAVQDLEVEAKDADVVRGGPCMNSWGR